jgi:hypothetical protein
LPACAGGYGVGMRRWIIYSVRRDQAGDEHAWRWVHAYDPTHARITHDASHPDWRIMSIIEETTHV